MRRALLAIAAAAACHSSDWDPSDPAVVLELSPQVTFPDQVKLPDATVSDPAKVFVPLDLAGGLPVRVQVSVATPALRAATGLTAHVWISDGAGGALPVTGGTSMTDIPMLTLEPGASPDGATTYTAITTLNAPWPASAADPAGGLEPVTVMAEVDGAVGTGVARITAPAIAAATPTVSPLWSGAAPHYDVCIETSASKGVVDLTADDPSVLTQPPGGAGTLITGACSPAITGGPAVSHTNFVLTYSPSPYAVVATLRGKPSNLASTGWVTSVVTPPSPGPVVTLAAAPPPAAEATAGGLLETVSVTATLPGGAPVVALQVSFAASGGAAFTPAQTVTDSGGIATSTVLVPCGATLTATMTSAGGGFVTTTVGQPIASIAAAVPVVVGSALSGGAIVSVTATASEQTAAHAPFPHLPIAFTASSGSFAPDSIAADDAGNATATVFVPYGLPSVTARICGGGAAQLVSLSSVLPPLGLAPPAATPMPGPPASLYQVRARVTAPLGGTTVGVSGIAVTFAQVGGASPFTPGTATTDADGFATTFAVLPAPIAAEVSAAGLLRETTLP